MEEKRRMSKLTMFAYGCGDFASNLCWTFIGSYLSIFYTDVVGIAPVVASALMLIAKTWDGFYDPMFGIIAERTNTKFGRFRPYILFGCPFLAVFSVLTFTTLGTGAVAWAAFTYIGCGMLYTVVNLSYGSLSTVMTNKTDELVTLGSYRMIGANIGAVLLNAISAPLLIHFSGNSDTYPASSYTKIAFIYAICAFPLFLFVFKMCKETIRPISKKKVAIKDSIKNVVANKPLMIIFIVQLFSLGSFFGRMGVAVYYFIYCMRRPDLISLLMALPSVMTIIGILVTKKLWVKIGRMKMQSIGLLGQAISLAAIWYVGGFVGYDNVTIIIILHAIYGFFIYTCAIPMGMVPDAIDYQEDKTGVRADGTSYAAVSLSTKLASAFGVSIALALMGVMGYVANHKQTEAGLKGINFSVNLFFAIIALIGIIPTMLYPISEKKNEEIKASLEQKRQNVITDNQ